MNDEVCQVKMRDKKPCGRQIYGDKKTCIFHLDKKSEEEAKIFEIVFWKELQRMEKDMDIKVLDFTRFIFPNYIFFKSHLFEKPVDFSGAQFNNRTSFSYSKFNGETSFFGAQFNDRTDFLSTQFNNETYFTNAQFNGETKFTGTQFNNKINFTDTKFNGETDFSHAKFNDETSFFGTQFNDRTDFLSTQFNNKTSFQFAQLNEASFSYAQFNNDTDFTHSKFQSVVSFIEAKFPSNGENFIFFRNSKFHKPKDVRFQNIDLNNVSFINTDVTEVELLDERWAKENGRLAVVDETRIGKDNSTTYDAVAQLYRRLRQNYETNYRFAEAGDFFIGEMEMRRLDVSTGNKSKIMRPIILWFKRNLSLLGIYKYLSFYGESYKLPVFWALIVLGSYPILMHWLFNVSIPNDFLTYMRESTASFFQMDTKYIGERIIGIPILGLLFIALKRQFERKK